MTIYDDILNMAQQLSPADKARLLAEIGASLRHDLSEPNAPVPTVSLQGLWEGDTVSAEAIDEARREMWRNFPRDDI